MPPPIVAARDAIRNSQSVYFDGRADGDVKHSTGRVAVHDQIVRTGSANGHAVSHHELARGQRDRGRVGEIEVNRVAVACVG